VEKVINVHT